MRIKIVDTDGKRSVKQFTLMLADIYADKISKYASRRIKAGAIARYLNNLFAVETGYPNVRRIKMKIILLCTGYACRVGLDRITENVGLKRKADESDEALRRRTLETMCQQMPPQKNLPN